MVKRLNVLDDQYNGLSDTFAVKDLLDAVEGLFDQNLILTG